MNRSYTQIDVTAPATLSKPYDLALHAVVKATEAAKAAHAAGTPTSACFQFRHLVCAVFTTPSGQLRYQVNPMGKPTRNSTHMLATLTEAEREAQAFAARGTRVPMKAEVNYCEGHAPTVLLTGRVLLALATNRGYNLYFHVGAMPRGQFGRKDFGGEQVEGPWAFANGRAVCLTASKALQDRDQAERDAAIMVKHGDLLVIDNAQYSVSVDRGEFINLNLLRDFTVDNVN